MSALLALLVLASPPPAGQGRPFEVILGTHPAALQAGFAPEGGPGTWSRERRGRILELTWTCQAEARCFATPSGASFWFVDDRLASATLTADPARAADAPGARLRLQVAAANLPPRVAETEAAGRKARYHRGSGQTVIWITDGPLTQIKLYLDALHPVGFAEAVAAGAPPQGLEKIPGAKAYAAAQLALAQRDFHLAVRALEELVAEPKASPLLHDAAKLVLALSLAARAQAQGPGPAALADLDRAAALVPALASELTELRARLTPRPTPTKP